MLLKPIKALIGFIFKTLLGSILIVVIYFLSTGRLDTLQSALQGVTDSIDFRELTQQIIRPVNNSPTSNTNTSNTNAGDQNNTDTANHSQTPRQTIVFNSADEYISFFIPLQNVDIDHITANPSILTKLPDYYQIKIRLNKEDPVYLRCKVLNTNSSRSLGYMYKPSISEYECLLFAFKSDSSSPFYMKNVNFPLDILFFDKDMKLFHIINKAPPCTGQKAKDNLCPLYFAPKPYRYVIELKPGVFR